MEDIPSWSQHLSEDIIVQLLMLQGVTTIVGQSYRILIDTVWDEIYLGLFHQHLYLHHLILTLNDGSWGV